MGEPKPDDDRCVVAYFQNESKVTETSETESETENKVPKLKSLCIQVARTTWRCVKCVVQLQVKGVQAKNDGINSSCVCDIARQEKEGTEEQRESPDICVSRVFYVKRDTVEQLACIWSSRVEDDDDNDDGDDDDGTRCDGNRRRQSEDRDFEGFLCKAMTIAVMARVVSLACLAFLKTVCVFTGPEKNLEMVNTKNCEETDIDRDHTAPQESKEGSDRQSDCAVSSTSNTQWTEVTDEGTHSDHSLDTGKQTTAEKVQFVLEEEDSHLLPTTESQSGICGKASCSVKLKVKKRKRLLELEERETVFAKNRLDDSRQKLLLVSKSGKDKPELLKLKEAFSDTEYSKDQPKNKKDAEESKDKEENVLSAFSSTVASTNTNIPFQPRRTYVVAMMRRSPNSGLSLTPQSQSLDYTSEWTRVASFHQAQVPPGIFVLRIAQNGFYLLDPLDPSESSSESSGQRTKVQCAFCGVRVPILQFREARPEEVHRRASPTCRFLTGGGPSGGGGGGGDNVSIGTTQASGSSFSFLGSGSGINGPVSTSPFPSQHGHQPHQQHSQRLLQQQADTLETDHCPESSLPSVTAGHHTAASRDPSSHGLSASSSLGCQRPAMDGSSGSASRAKIPRMTPPHNMDPASYHVPTSPSSTSSSSSIPTQSTSASMSATVPTFSTSSAASATTADSSVTNTPPAVSHISSFGSMSSDDFFTSLASTSTATTASTAATSDGARSMVARDQRTSEISPPAEAQETVTTEASLLPSSSTSRDEENMEVSSPTVVVTSPPDFPSTPVATGSTSTATTTSTFGTATVEAGSTTATFASSTSASTATVAAASASASTSAAAAATAATATTASRPEGDERSGESGGENGVGEASSSSTTGGSQTEAEQQMVTYENLGIFTQQPKRPDMVVTQTRINTFGQWPREATHPAIKMAEAGFYYTGHQDLVRCFFCKGGLKTWEQSDQPWVEHCRWFPRCPFIRLAKGEKFVEAVRKLNNTGTQPTISEDQVRGEVEKLEEMERRGVTVPPPEPMTVDPYTEVLSRADLRPDVEIAESKLAELSENLESEREDMINVTLCKMCQVEEVSVLFLPCGHLVACAQCAPALRNCAVCRQSVKGSVRVRMDHPDQGTQS